MKKHLELSMHHPVSIPSRNGKLKLVEIAKELNISKSYMSMIASGQRKCPLELVEKLQSIPGVHKVVNNQLWLRTGSQKVVGSNPISSTSLKTKEYCLLKSKETLTCNGRGTAPGSLRVLSKR